MRRLISIGLILAAMTALPVGVARADSTGTPGQPNQSCEDAFPRGPVTPQGFNTTGFDKAASMYAGSQDKNSKNPKSVSQYDVACFQAVQHSGR